MSSTNPVQRTRILSRQNAEVIKKAVCRPRTNVSEARSGAKATVAQVKDVGQKRAASARPDSGAPPTQFAGLARVHAGKSKAVDDIFDRLDQAAKDLDSKRHRGGAPSGKPSGVARPAVDGGQKRAVQAVPYPGEKSDPFAANWKKMLGKFKGVQTRGDLNSWGTAFDRIGHHVQTVPKRDEAKSVGRQEITSGPVISQVEDVKTRSRSDRVPQRSKAYTAVDKLKNGGEVPSLTLKPTFIEETSISQFPEGSGPIAGLEFKQSLLKCAKSNVDSLDYRAGGEIRIGSQCASDIYRINLTVYDEDDEVLYQSKTGGQSNPKAEIEAALEAIKELTKDTHAAEVVASFVGDQQFPTRAFQCLSAAMKKLENFKPSSAGAALSFGHALVETSDGKLSKISGDKFGGGARIPVSLRKTRDGNYRVDLGGSPAVMVPKRANEAGKRMGVEGRVVHMNCTYTINGDEAARLKPDIVESSVTVSGRVEGTLEHVKRNNVIWGEGERPLQRNAKNKVFLSGSRPGSPRAVSPGSPSASPASSSPVTSPVASPTVSPTQSPRGKSTGGSIMGSLRRKK